MFEPGLTQIIFAELIRGSPAYAKNRRINYKYMYIYSVRGFGKKVESNLHLKENMNKKLTVQKYHPLVCNHKMLRVMSHDVYK